MINLKLKTTQCAVKPYSASDMPATMGVKTMLIMAMVVVVFDG